MTCERTVKIDPADSRTADPRCCCCTPPFVHLCKGCLLYGRMQIPRDLFFLLTLIATLITIGNSKVWNAHELLIGEWDLDLHGGCFFSPHRIFPRTTFGEGQHLSVQRRPWGSSLSCSLSLCPDGTFLLRPKECPCDGAQDLLLMRGHWDVLSNPYCITDRFYDQLQLRSLPRATCVATEAGSSPKAGAADLSCRVWGRYMGSETLGRQGWMTHGTLVWRNGDRTSVKASAPKRVLASFTAKRSQREPKIHGWEDQEVFGY
jgi:hypothetical protein